MAICEQCGKEHDGSFGSGRFCCRSCSCKWVALSQSGEAKARKVEKGKQNLVKGWKLSPEQIQEFSSIGRERASQNMRRRMEEKIAAILSGEDTESAIYHGGYSRFRDYLIEFGYKEHKCERCGLTEWLGGPIPIELHHKDPNGGNVLDNLEILCPNCHALTDSHGWKYYNNYLKKSSLSSTG